jgi:hypothetical protein
VASRASGLASLGSKQRVRDTSTRKGATTMAFPFIEKKRTAGFRRHGYHQLTETRRGPSRRPWIASGTASSSARLLPILAALVFPGSLMR